MIFPEYRARRLRQNENFRALIRETSIAPAHLVYPLFVMPGKGVREEV
ncbi:MAG: porphobilinogen synthase, partial [Desulfurivibrionaceae bacterium]